MNNYCRIQCFGCLKVPIKKWIVDSHISINRLYYILGGDGGYIKGDKKHPFIKGHLYLLPGFADITVYTSYDPLENRLNHSFVNFEMLPPIISNEVIELDPADDPEVEMALGIFNSICKKRMSVDIDTMDKTDIEYLRSTIIYLTQKMISHSNVKLLEDPVVLKTLEMMHTNLSATPSIAEMAKECSMSIDGFIRRFKKNMGEPPYLYLKKLRVSVAMGYKKNGVPLEQIAEKCGYSDASTLSHAIARTLKKEPPFR